MSGDERAARWPRGFLGMLGLLALVESFLAARPEPFSDVTAFSRRYSIAAAKRLAPGRDVLLLGDSMVKIGLFPQVIRERTGRSTVNLAAPSGPASATFETLRRALDAGARPSAIVVDFGPGILAAPLARDAPRRPGLPAPRDFLDLVWTARDPTLAVHLALNGLFPSVRGRHEVRACAWEALHGVPSSQAEVNRACRRNWRLNDGAMVSAKNPAYDGSPHLNAGGMAAPVHPRFQPLYVAYLERTLALAEAHGIAVYWLVPPVVPRLQALRERRGAEVHYTRFARSILARHPGVTVLDARGSGYDTRLFVDATHLDLEGATALSTAVADCLGAPSGGSRWVDLPPPVVPAPGPRPEDFDQSRAFVRSAAASVVR